MPIGKSLWAALALLAMWLVAPPVLAATGDRIKGTLGHVSASVPYGGQFSRSQAEVLAQAKAWLDGVEMTARTLSSMDAVRLSGLDFLQVQALAASLDGVERIPFSANEVEDALGQNLPNAEARITLRVAQPDAAAVSQALANEADRERLEELILALRRLLPEALEWADRGRDLRKASSPATQGQPDDMVAARLSLLTSASGAALAYLDFLLGAPLTTDLQVTLDWAQDIVPPLAAARADMLLRQDRPQAALDILRDLSSPSTSTTDNQQWIQARSSAWSDVWKDAWPPHPSDSRLYARSLYLRGMAQLRSGQPTLAEADFSAALAIDAARPDFLLARGATYQVREMFDAMCSDYYLACTLGACDGLAAAREQGRCLPQ